MKFFLQIFKNLIIYFETYPISFRSVIKIVSHCFILYSYLKFHAYLKTFVFPRQNIQDEFPKTYRTSSGCVCVNVCPCRYWRALKKLRRRIVPPKKPFYSHSRAAEPSTPVRRRTTTNRNIILHCSFMRNELLRFFQIFHSRPKRILQ